MSEMIRRYLFCSALLLSRLPVRPSASFSSPSTWATSLLLTTALLYHFAKFEAVFQTIRYHSSTTSSIASDSSHKELEIQNNCSTHSYIRHHRWRSRYPRSRRFQACHVYHPVPNHPFSPTATPEGMTEQTMIEISPSWPFVFISKRPITNNRVTLTKFNIRGNYGLHGNMESVAQAICIQADEDDWRAEK